MAPWGNKGDKGKGNGKGQAKGGNNNGKGSGYYGNGWDSENLGHAGMKGMQTAINKQARALNNVLKHLKDPNQNEHDKNSTQNQTQQHGENKVVWLCSECQTGMTNPKKQTCIKCHAKRKPSDFVDSGSGGSSSSPSSFDIQFPKIQAPELTNQSRLEVKAKAMGVKWGITSIGEDSTTTADAMEVEQPHIVPALSITPTTAAVQEQQQIEAEYQQALLKYGENHRFTLGIKEMRDKILPETTQMAFAKEELSLSQFRVGVLKQKTQQEKHVAHLEQEGLKIVNELRVNMEEAKSYSMGELQRATQKLQGLEETSTDIDKKPAAKSPPAAPAAAAAQASPVPMLDASKISAISAQLAAVQGSEGDKQAQYYALLESALMAPQAQATAAADTSAANAPARRQAVAAEVAGTAVTVESTLAAAAATPVEPRHILAAPPVEPLTSLLPEKSAGRRNRSTTPRRNADL